MLSVCGCHCTAYLQCVYSGLSWSIAWWHVDGTSMALSVPERLSWWSHALRISIGKLSECLKGVDPSQLRHMPDKLKDWQPLRPLPWFSMIYSWYPHFPWWILQLAGFNSVPTSSAGVLLRCVILCHDLPPNVTPGLLGCMHVRAVQFWLICDTCFKLAQMMGFCFCFCFFRMLWESQHFWQGRSPLKSIEVSPANTGTRIAIDSVTQELARKVHAWQVEDSRPSSRQAAQPWFSWPLNLGELPHPYGWN